MDEQTAAKLRAQFTPEEIGKLPRVTCGDCADKRKTCDKHRKERCDICKAWVSEKHIHIDYVGHADVTSRLLEADPDWNWEPKAEDEHGLPVLDTDVQGNPVGLWIKLTVGGVTRLGYGSCPSGQGDAVKVLIGDALRNAAMRFGVALDLWAKGDRADPSAENATASAGHATGRGSRRESAGDAWENASRARPAAEPASEDREWAAQVARIPTFGTDDEGRELWRAVADRQKAGKIRPPDARKLQEKIKARWAQLKDDAKEGTLVAPLDPADPWAARVEEIASEADAEVLTEEVAKADIDPDKAASVHAAIAARLESLRVAA